jgi:hypothetical protein
MQGGVAGWVCAGTGHFGWFWLVLAEAPRGRPVATPSAQLKPTSQKEELRSSHPCQTAELHRGIRRTGDSTMRRKGQGCYVRKDKIRLKRGKERSLRAILRPDCSSVWLSFVVPGSCSIAQPEDAIGRPFSATRQGRGGPRGPQGNWLQGPCLFRFAVTLDSSDWHEATLDPCTFVASLRVKWGGTVVSGFTVLSTQAMLLLSTFPPF